MGSIYLLVIIVVGLANGQVNVQTEVHWPNDPNYNTEQLCNEAGKAMAERIQKEPATGNGVVFWQCHKGSLDDMAKGVSASAPKANGEAL